MSLVQEGAVGLECQGAKAAIGTVLNVIRPQDRLDLLSPVNDTHH